MVSSRNVVWKMVAVGCVASGAMSACSFSATSYPEPKVTTKSVKTEERMLQAERKLKASGCNFELNPGATRPRDEHFTCFFDPRSRGATAVADTLVQISKLQEMIEAVRDYTSTADLESERREQLDHRMAIVGDEKTDLKNQLVQLLDVESGIQLAVAGLGPSGCEVVGSKLACEEAVDLVQAMDQITALKRLQAELDDLFEGHAPILKVPLADYQALNQAVDSRRTRLEDSVRSRSDSGSIGVRIPGVGPGGIKASIAIDGGLLVSASQVLLVAKTINDMAKLIADQGLAPEMRTRAFRRVVISPLVAESEDVDFNSVTQTVYIPDSVKPAAAIEFLRHSCASKEDPRAAEQAQGLDQLMTQAKVLRDSGDLSTFSLPMIAGVARHWPSAVQAHEKILAVLQQLKNEGLWTDSVKASVSLIAGDRFAAFGESEMALIVNIQAPVPEIMAEIRSALQARANSVARLLAL